MLTKYGSSTEKIKKKVRNRKTCSDRFATRAIIEGKIKQLPVVNQSICQVVQMADAVGSAVTIALSAQSVMSKRIKLPVVLQEEECEIEISNRLQHYLPGLLKSSLSILR